MQEDSRVDPQAIDDVVAWTVIRAARSAGRMMTAVLRPYGLTPVEFGVLAQLAAHGSLPQAAIARAVEVRPGSMARTSGP